MASPSFTIELKLPRSEVYMVLTEILPRGGQAWGALKKQPQGVSTGERYAPLLVIKFNREWQEIALMPPSPQLMYVCIDGLLGLFS